MVHIRSLVKAGQTSHTVSLPKEWLDKNNLKRGDLIYLHENGEKELLITPHLLKDTPQELKEITISIDKKEIDTIQREITSAYINNYHLINIAGENLSEHLKDIRNIIQDFVALEVVEQTNKRIVVKDLLNLDDIAIDKTIKRMDMVVRSMLQDSKGSVEKPELDESIRFRDEDVNRIYFLLFRLLKSALKNPKIAEKFGLS
ncbi:MAG: phosphate uptake regulator PhoU, partial [Nanoarchaeota archaeon]